MNYQHEHLKRKIHEVRSQWRKLIILKGGAQVIVATLAVFGLAFALDSFFELGMGVRAFLLVLMAAVFLGTAYFELFRPLVKVPSETQIARFLEEKHPHLQDRLVTAIEFGDIDDPKVSKIIVEKLLEDARFQIEPLNLRKAIRARTASIWGGTALAAAALAVAPLFMHLDFFSLKSSRILAPWEFPTVEPKPELLITPGDLRVQQGSVQEIKAELTAFEADDVSLYFSDGDTTWHKVEMDPALSENIFVYNLFDLQEDTRYYVKADDRLSDVFTFSVFAPPKIKRVDVICKYPDYTGLPAKKERDSGDVWAPEGTVVTVTAVADKPLQGASISMGEGGELKTTIRQDTLAVASFTIKEDDFYKIAVTDLDQLTNEPAPEYYVHALHNQPPILTFEWPGRDIKATMLEEVPIRVRVQDDFGRPKVSLKYVINGGKKMTLPLDLRQRKSDSGEHAGLESGDFQAEHLFYFEDMNLHPGDFMTYYLEATDVANGKSTTSNASSDIFFVEVRPFEKEFTRPVSQGQQMAGGGNSVTELSRTQKEIIIATWKTAQQADKVERHRFEEDLGILKQSQKNLKEVAESTLFQLQQRSVFTNDVNDDVTKYYTKAIEAMSRALKDLGDEKLTEAQTPQREALQQLLLAEAQIREVQIQQSQGQGQGGNQAHLDELSELFEQEMDKLKNKYETLQENRQRASDNAMNEAMDKIRDLARRQEDFNRQMQDLTRQNIPEEEKKRRIEELQRKQEEIRRETQNLSRQMANQEQNQTNQGLSRNVQQSLQDAASEMNNVSHNLRNENTDLASAKSTRALNRLSRLEDLLQRNQKESLRRQVDELQQQFDEMSKSQKELSDQVSELARSGQQGREQEMQNAGLKQENLREKLASAQEDMERLNSSARRSKDETAREISKFSREAGSEELQQKMQKAEQLLQSGQLNSASQAQKDILKEMERVNDELSKLRSGMAESDEEKLDLALNQTRKMLDNLEQVQREMQELKENQSGPQGQAKAEQPGNSGESRQPGPGEVKSQPEKLDPQKLDWMNEQLARSKKDLDLLQNSLPDDAKLNQSAQDLGSSLHGTLRTFTGGVDRFDIIEKQVLVPLRQLEAELAQRLELLKNKEKLFLARDERIPPDYKDLVEKYYESLSKTRQ